MKCALYTTKVDPEKGNFELGGFQKRAKSEEQVGSGDLYAKIAWLKLDGGDLLLVTLDTLYFSSFIASRVVEYAETNYGLNESSIIFNASHTHAAPNTAIAKFGKIDDEYVKEIIKKILI